MSDTERLELINKLDRAGSRLRLMAWIIFVFLMIIAWLIVLGICKFGAESLVIAPIASVITSLFLFDYFFSPIDAFYECLRSLISKPGDPSPPVISTTN